nr:uncharacterized protein LOC111859268 [Paramormyrops kingsleyae]
MFLMGLVFLTFCFLGCTSGKPIPSAINVLPLMIPQLPVLTDPLADSDAQPPVYTVIIQQPVMAGSVSSEEVIQPPTVYRGILVAMIPGNQNMGLTNSGGKSDRDTPSPDGLSRNPEVHDIPDPSPSTAEGQGGAMSAQTAGKSPVGVQLGTRTAPPSSRQAQRQTASPWRPQEAVSLSSRRMKPAEGAKGQRRERKGISMQRGDAI